MKTACYHPERLYSLGVATCVSGNLILRFFECSMPVVIRKSNNHYTLLVETLLCGNGNGDTILVKYLGFY